MADSVPRTKAAFIHSRLDDLRLSPVQFRVYAHMERRASAGGVFYESVPNCAKFCGIRDETLRAATKHLLSLGLIVVEKATPGKTVTYRVTHIEEWPVHPPLIEYPPTQTGGVSKPGDTTAVSGGGGGPLKPGDTPAVSGGTKVIPLRESPQGDPIKGEAPPLPVRISDTERITREKELGRVEARIKTIKSSYDEHSTWSKQDRMLMEDLKERRTELMQILGMKF